MNGIILSSVTPMLKSTWDNISITDNSRTEDFYKSFVEILDKNGKRFMNFEVEANKLGGRHFNIVAKKRDDSDYVRLLEIKENKDTSIEATINTKRIELINSIGSDYIRYESGLQICYKHQEIRYTKHIIVNFPVPFKNNDYRVIATDSGGDCITYGASVNNTSSFNLYAPYEGAYVAYYIAIGLWK